VYRDAALLAASVRTGQDVRPGGLQSTGSLLRHGAGSGSPQGVLPNRYSPALSKDGRAEAGCGEASALQDYGVRAEGGLQAGARDDLLPVSFLLCHAV